MTEEKPKKSTARSYGHLALLVLIILVVFCVVVMVLNSKKPQPYASRTWTQRSRGFILSGSLSS